MLVLAAIQSAYDALMRGDPGPLVALMAPEVEWRGVPHGLRRHAPA
jgi:ketosteroid isomerase-like protein